MDKLTKCYLWHIITLSKMKLRLRELKVRKKLERGENNE